MVWHQDCLVLSFASYSYLFSGDHCVGDDRKSLKANQERVGYQHFRHPVRTGATLLHGSSYKYSENPDWMMYPEYPRSYNVKSKDLKIYRLSERG